MSGIPSTILDCAGVASGLTLPAVGGVASILINAVTILLTAVLINNIAIRYNLVKERTLLPALFFLLFQLLNTTLTKGLFIGNVTTLIVIVTVIILYSCYQMKFSTEKGFLIAIILSLSSLCEARILYLLPLIMVGFVQMQAASWRTFAAVVVGLITPYWIVCGMGWVECSSLDFATLLPQFNFSAITVAHIPVIVTIIIGFVVGCFNLSYALNEKIHTRAMNGFVNLLSVYTTLIMLIDNGHYTHYLPLLNASVALQATYFFTTLRNRTTAIIFYTITTLLIAGVIYQYLYC